MLAKVMREKDKGHELPLIRKIPSQYQQDGIPHHQQAEVDY